MARLGLPSSVMAAAAVTAVPAATAAALRAALEGARAALRDEPLSAGDEPLHPSLAAWATLQLGLGDPLFLLELAALRALVGVGDHVARSSPRAGRRRRGAPEGSIAHGAWGASRGRARAPRRS